MDLAIQGVEVVTLATGYRSDVIEDYFKTHGPVALEIRFSREPRPLGTGGGLCFALEAVSADKVLILNGDTYCPFDLATLTTAHKLESDIEATVWAVPWGETATGSVDVIVPDGRGRVLSFQRLSEPQVGDLVCAGIYAICRQAILDICDQPQQSLENLLLPLANRGTVRVVLGAHPFTDIGTPGSLAVAPARLRTSFARLNAAYGTWAE